MFQLVSDRSALLTKLWSAEIAPRLTLLQACQYMALDSADVEHFEGEPHAIANAIWSAGLFLNQGDEPGTGRLLPIDEGRFRAKFPELVGLLPAFSEPGVFLPAGPLKLKPACVSAPEAQRQPSRPTLVLVK